MMVLMGRGDMGKAEGTVLRYIIFDDALDLHTKALAADINSSKASSVDSSIIVMIQLMKTRKFFRLELSYDKIVVLYCDLIE